MVPNLPDQPKIDLPETTGTELQSPQEGALRSLGVLKRRLPVVRGKTEVMFFAFIRPSEAYRSLPGP